MASKATYKIIGLGLDAKIYSRDIKGAPTDGVLALWATRKKLAFVARYFPSRKGWVVFECREVRLTAVRANSGRSYSKILNFNRIPRTIATEDAAVMLMLHKLNPPVQETLNL